ncbi:MAG: molybdopterin-binding protein [Deltaproteobacteria bacterium]|nr:molybdopterin-binding protein [Deltaproteobacteria bacterium]MDZ4343119.1 molybdopterin-binding protein [Candidatus Binatia bacterium]
MLKVIPVEEAVGLPLAHDITEIVPGKYKGPAFRRGHIIRPEDVSKLLDVGKANIYVMNLEKDELHEEDAARRLAKAAAGRNLKLTDPSEGRINLVAEIPGLLKIDADLLYIFNSLGDLMLATLPGNRYVKEGTVVAGTRTIPVVVKEALIQKAEGLCKEKPIVTLLPMPSKRVHLVVTGSEVFTGRIKDGFEPVVSRKVGEMGSHLESVKLAPDDPDVIAGHIKNAQQAGAEIILVSGGMSVDPDDKTPEGIRRSGAKIESHGFPVLPGSMFVMAYFHDTPVLGLSGCVLHDSFTAFDLLLPRLLAGEKITRADIMAMGHGGLQIKHDH